LNEEKKKVLERIKSSLLHKTLKTCFYCESISKTEGGIVLHGQLSFDPESYLFADPADPHLEKLRIIFKTSQAEIRESILFLVENGFTVEQIYSETGASHATIYRYLRKQ
jgi:hypothetical protein